MASGERSDGWIDVLVPAPGKDAGLDALSGIELVDAGERFHLGPLDQALVSATEKHVSRRKASNDILVQQVPRGRHDLAITLGFALQALRLQTAGDPFGALFTFRGSVTVAGMDTAVQDRLRGVHLAGVSFARGLAEGLGAKRVRADGTLVDPTGAVIAFDPRGRHLLYLNARVGWPDLAGEQGGVVIIDRTSLSSNDTLIEALRWAERHQPSGIIVLADLGDTSTCDASAAAGFLPCTLPWNPSLLDGLVDVLGRGSGVSALTTNVLLNATHRPVNAHLVDVDASVDEAFRIGFRAAAVARRVRGVVPFQVTLATRLLTGTSRCVDDVDSYDRHAIDQPGGSSLRVLSRRLQRADGGFSAPWRSFAQTYWAGLRHAALAAHGSIQTRNLKLEALVDVIDRVSRRQLQQRIVVRVSNRAAVASLTATLAQCHQDLVTRTGLTVHAWSERLPWTADPTVEIHAAPPPVYAQGVLWTGEATEHIVLAYSSELSLLQFISRHNGSFQRDALRASFTVFHLGEPPEPLDPLEVSEARGGDGRDVNLTIPAVDLERVLAEMAELSAAIDDADDLATRPTIVASSESLSLVPVLLTTRHTWWLLPDAMVDALVGGHYRQRQVAELRAGDVVIVPRGAGRESLFTRLVAAYHRDADVADLDLVLSRFRRDCWRLYERCDHNWAEVRRAVERAGLNAVNQTRSWAEGETIAPADPEDVRRIADLVADIGLAAAWARIPAVAAVLRSSHARLGRVVSRALEELGAGGGEAIDQLNELLGRGAAEVLDEFVVARVESVGGAVHRPAALAGSVR
jgi:hypothetical protein